MARLSGLQLRALALVLLLAGHEAARVQQETEAMVAAAGRGSHSRFDDVEETWQKENAVCELTMRGCKGQLALPVNATQCKWRPLPLDVLPSESCRLSDEFMLRSRRKTYFKLQTELLAAKAKKFKEWCRGMKIWKLASVRGSRCQRRAKHMLRAMEFIAKSQDRDLVSSLSAGEKQREMELFDEALGSLSESIGPDGVKVLELRQKMKADKAGLRRDPTGKVQEILRLLQMLLLGTKEERQKAQEEISELPSHPTGDEAGEDADGLADLAATLERDADGLSGVIDDANAFEGEVEEPRGSLVEVGHNSSSAGADELDLSRALSAGREGLIVGITAFVVLAVLVVCVVIFAAAELIGAIVGWALAAILGCGIYSAGYNAMAAKAERGKGGKAVAAVKEQKRSAKVTAKMESSTEKRGVKTTMMCIAKVFVFPFVLVGKGVQKLWKFIRNSRNTAKDQRKRLKIPPKN